MIEILAVTSRIHDNFGCNGNSFETDEFLIHYVLYCTSNYPYDDSNL